jgi:hypothetical protein
MMRKILFSLTIAAATFGLAGTASAQTTQAPPSSVSPVKCVGAPQHKQAQALRLQAAQADLAALQARRSAAVAANRADIVARIDVRIAKVTARIAKIQSNQAAFALRCP